MDAQHTPPVFATPPVLAGRSAGASTGIPLIDLAPPYKPSARREGRFFEIRLLPSGMWRCILKTGFSADTGLPLYVTFRDFGYSDEDYLRAWEFGNEWANS